MHLSSKLKHYLAITSFPAAINPWSSVGKSKHQAAVPPHSIPIGECLPPVARSLGKLKTGCIRGSIIDTC